MKSALKKETKNLSDGRDVNSHSMQGVFDKELDRTSNKSDIQPAGTRKSVIFQEDDKAKSDLKVIVGDKAGDKSVGFKDLESPKKDNENFNQTKEP